MNAKVAIYKQHSLHYSNRAPYFPPAIFAEYPFANKTVDTGNEAYFSLRELFKMLDLDSKNFGKNNWNPLSFLVSPGQTVLLKPNLMRHFADKGSTDKLITHGSVIRAIADYVYIALNGKGRIIIADGPMDDGDFGKICRITGLDEIKRFYKKNAGFDIEIYDLRQEQVFKKGNEIIRRLKLSGDPMGYTAIDLFKHSEFKKDSLDYTTFKGSECISSIMNAHHNDKKNEYLVSNTLLNADVVINIPKLKTHNKAGVTLSLKNMVGITGDRNWLPHFKGVSSKCNRINKRGSKVSCVLNKGIIKYLKDKVKELRGLRDSDIKKGNWHGNNIIWRMILDLSRIVMYADKKGKLQKEVQRKNFFIIDGIVGGEGDGPMNPDPKPCGVLMAGFDSLCVDMAAARLMGFDPKRIPQFKNFSNSIYKDIKVVSNLRDWDRSLSQFKGRCLGFKPFYGWRHHIEVKDEK
ncbi:MAG: DUF362 domain-containing protein [Candidatus Gorgyraea atricola]|nr:DUF362 domain-containing protein [Candidatus Gorgyraea atricola]